MDWCREHLPPSPPQVTLGGQLVSSLRPEPLHTPSMSAMSYGLPQDVRMAAPAAGVSSNPPMLDPDLDVRCCDIPARALRFLH